MRRLNAAVSGKASPSIMRAWSNSKCARSARSSAAPPLVAAVAIFLIRACLGLISRILTDWVSSCLCAFNMRSRRISISPSSATRHTALSVKRSDVRTSLTDSPKVCFTRAIKVATSESLAVSSFSLLTCSGSSPIFDRSVVPRVVDVNAWPSYSKTADSQKSSTGSDNSSTSTPRAR